MPVPQMELLSDGELKLVAADAATALLDRVVPKVVKAIEPPRETTPTHGNATMDPFGLEDEDDSEIHDTTSSSWRVHRPETRRPVTWGAPVPQQRVMRADMSSTGTFRVTPLHARGSVSPTHVPGLRTL